MDMDVAAQYSSFLKVMSYYVTVGVLSLSRWLGFFFFFPLIKWIQIPQTIQYGIAFAFSLPVWPLVAHDLAESHMLIYPILSTGLDTVANPFPKVALGGIMLKEFVVGVMLSMFPSMIFMGLSLAGEVIDTARGDNKNSESGNDSLPMGNGGLFLFLIASTVFMYSGEFMKMIRIIYDSYKTWPIHQTTEVLTIGKIGIFAQQAVEVLFHSVIIYIPILIMLQSLDIIVFFQSKIDSKFHGEDQTPILKNLLFMAIMMFYMYLINAQGYTPLTDMTEGLKKVVYE